MIVYVSIGNSDDKLKQVDWAAFHATVNRCILTARGYRGMHGRWVSEPTSPWQNACWCFEIRDSDMEFLKKDLRSLAQEFDQDSIAWAQAPVTEFLGA